MPRPADYDESRGFNLIYDPEIEGKKKPDLVIVASEFLVQNSIQASQILAEKGLKVRVINATRMKSLKSPEFVNLLENDVPVLTIFNGNPDILQNAVAGAAGEYPLKRPSIIAGHGYTTEEFDGLTSAPIAELLKYFKFDPAGIIEIIQEKFNLAI